MKSLFEELGGTYHQEGDYFLPDSISVGIWGQRRKHYLKIQREPVYVALLLGGKLDSHLSEVGAQAEAMLFQLVKQKDADVLTAAFKEYSVKLSRKEKRPSVLKALAHLKELAKSIPSKVREKNQERER